MRRRCKALRVHEEAILDILSWKQRGMLPVFSGLPEGAEVERVHYSCSHMCFELLIYHPSFEEIDPSHDFPEINGHLSEFEWLPFKHAEELWRAHIVQTSGAILDSVLKEVKGHVL